MNTIKGNDIRIFQLHVIESSYRIKKITLKHYITQTLDLIKKYGATVEIVVLLMSNIQANRNKKFVKELLQNNKEYLLLIDSMIETKIIDLDGKILKDLNDDFFKDRVSLPVSENENIESVELTNNGFAGIND